MNNIMANEAAISNKFSTGMKRQQIQEASLMGLGALSFADILLMLFSPNMLNGQAGTQAAVQGEIQPGTQAVAEAGTPANNQDFGQTDILAYVQAIAQTGQSEATAETPAVQEGISTGTDGGPVFRLGAAAGAALPFLRQMNELTPEVEAAIQTALAAQAKTPEVSVRQSSETGLSGISISGTEKQIVQTGGNASERILPFDSQVKEQTQTVPAISVKSESAPQSKPWEGLYRTVGEVKLRLNRELSSDDTEVMQGLIAAGAGENPKAAAPIAEKAEVISPSDTLAEQVSSGVLEKLTEGKSEFTIKLKPESLGEITVKLIEESGKMTLRIEAASSETAKLINNDLSALREAVRPMQVEVHEAVTPAPDTSQTNFQQFSMGGQQQFSNNQSYHQGQTASYAYEFSPDADEAETPVSLSSNGLDRYV